VGETSPLSTDWPRWLAAAYNPANEQPAAPQQAPVRRVPRTLVWPLRRLPRCGGELSYNVHIYAPGIYIKRDASGAAYAKL
jgi:hypothetical protein